MTEFMSGHGNFAKYRDQFHIQQGAECGLCTAPQQTPGHLITDCPAFALERHDFILKVLDTTKAEKMSLELTSIDECYADLYKFIKITYKRLRN